MSSLCSDIVIIVGSSIREAHIFLGSQWLCHVPDFHGKPGFCRTLSSLDVGG